MATQHRGTVTVGTDGSCLRNPGGPTGWAWVDHAGTWRAGAIATGTNNIGELWGILAALRDHPTGPLTIQTDSQYALTCITNSQKWAKAGWVLRDGSLVANKALLVAIRRRIDARDTPPRFEKVPGHDPQERWPLNTHADKCAHWAAEQAQNTGRDEEFSGRIVITKPLAPPADPKPIRQAPATRRQTAFPAGDGRGSLCPSCNAFIDINGDCRCSR